jgi:hypothetical protein
LTCPPLTRHGPCRQVWSGPASPALRGRVDRSLLSLCLFDGSGH